MSDTQGASMLFDPATSQSTASHQRGQVLPTSPIPFVPATNPVVFVSSLKNSNIHRKDGATIPFVHGFYRTRNQSDIDFLDYEIAMGHPFIRRADDQEVSNYQQLVDPDTTLRAKVEAEITPLLEAKIRAQLEEQIKTGQFVIDPSNTKVPLAVPVPTPITDEQKIAGIDSPKTTETVKLPGAQVTMLDKPSQLSGMASTAKLPS